jgi:hypothetical protein
MKTATTDKAMATAAAFGLTFAVGFAVVRDRHEPPATQPIESRLMGAVLSDTTQVAQEAVDAPVGSRPTTTDVPITTTPHMTIDTTPWLRPQDPIGGSIYDRCNEARDELLEGIDNDQAATAKGGWTEGEHESFIARTDKAIKEFEEQWYGNC